jgi:hypothetical protein
MKIAIIDSGVHPEHPHVERIAGGVAITEGGLSGDFIDRLGHGTAVAGAIREKAPEADLYAVKVFDRRLSATIEVLVRAIEWCVEQEMDVINLSLGTANKAHRERFERALDCGPLVVSVAGMLPGTQPGAIAVAPEDCSREIYGYRNGIFYASAYPRAIPGVPPERNLNGASFAVANMTGFAARAFRQAPRSAAREALIAGAYGTARCNSNPLSR